MAMATNTTKTVGLLVEAAKLDTVYRDLYLRRARQLLSVTLDESAYRAIGSSEKDIEDLVRRSRSAVLKRDWGQAAELSAKADGLRQRKAAMRNQADIGKDVYEADTVAFDPFSPGKHLGQQSEAKQPALRTQLVATLASLGKLDSSLSALCEKRRGYFSGLEMASPGASQKKGAQRTRAQVEQLALEAAERGDSAALQKLAKELQQWKMEGATTTAGSVDASAVLSRYQCPVNLDAPFLPAVIERARDIGLVEARTAPLAKLAKVREVIYAHVAQPVPSNPDMEKEGVLRARAQAELEIPTQLDTEEARVLVSQFIQQIFINSGGARYLPPLAAERTLIEDFAEDETAAKAPSKLLEALGLVKRNGCARTEIEAALMRFGDQILEERLGLDPMEFRLVCIPSDLYVRFGSDHGFGQWAHWTHFDGYQFMGGNRLRALVGGDGRFGGLKDIVSISPSDAREGVYVRFAVVRRARMAARWR
jgi:hypothetical protein